MTRTAKEKATLLRDEAADIRMQLKASNNYPYALGRAFGLLLMAEVMLESVDPVDGLKAIESGVSDHVSEVGSLLTPPYDKDDALREDDGAQGESDYVTPLDLDSELGQGRN